MKNIKTILGLLLLIVVAGCAKETIKNEAEATTKLVKAAESDEPSYVLIWGNLITQLANSEKSLVLRDYHSPNLLWMNDASSLDCIGLIDFQDAMIGPCAYDVAS